MRPQYMYNETTVMQQNVEPCHLPYTDGYADV